MRVEKQARHYRLAEDLANFGCVLEVAKLIRASRLPRSRIQIVHRAVSRVTSGALLFTQERLTTSTT
jgi:hypothetical protein